MPATPFAGFSARTRPGDHPSVLGPRQDAKNTSPRSKSKVLRGVAPRIGRFQGILARFALSGSPGNGRLRRKCGSGKGRGFLFGMYSPDKTCPAGRAPCAGGGHFVACNRFAGSSRWSAQEIVATNGSTARSPGGHQVPRASGCMATAGSIIPS
jgi:hypothetical protein